MTAVDTHEKLLFQHDAGENVQSAPISHTKAEVQTWLGGGAHIADADASTMDTLTDNSGGAVSTTLASISDTATKNAVASLNAQLVKAKADVTALVAKLNAVLARMEAFGINAAS